MAGTDEIIVSFENVTKRYGDLTVLDKLNLDIYKNEMVSIIGPSGSGKSTMMNMIGCLDTPSSGSYEFEGEMVNEMNDDHYLRVKTNSG